MGAIEVRELIIKCNGDQGRRVNRELQEGNVSDNNDSSPAEELIKHALKRFLKS
jgi:hypothetical protein